MDINDRINRVITMLDADTLEHQNRYMPLILMGDVERSPFLRAIIRKADQLGIKTEVTTTPQHKHPVVMDRETCPKHYIEHWLDVDNMFSDGMSSVAEAIYLLLLNLNLIAGKNICIVGRGHAVQGLAETLIKDDATVTVAHSKTESLLKATMGNDVVIYATPKVDKIVACDTDALVIDVGRCIEHPELFYCDYVNNIGKLTVSVLLNRFVHMED